MRYGLLCHDSTGGGSRGDAAGGTASSSPAGGRVLAAERESLHAVRHVLLQGIEEAHLRSGVLRSTW